MANESFDVVVIGSGPGGYVAAIRAAQLGLRTAIVEKYPTLGGTCLNVGCIPSKALLESSEQFHQAKHGFAAHGIEVGELSFDLAVIQQRKAGIVKELTDGIAGLMKKNKIEVFVGEASLAGPNTVTVAGGPGTIELETKQIILATGSKPVDLPFMQRDGVHILNSTDVLSLGAVPDHLVVVGAGAVGLELGSVWMRLGARVTVVEMLPQIAPFADKAMAKTLQRSLKGQGMAFMLKTQVSAADIGDDGVTLTVQTEGKEPTKLSCDKVLVAVGRRPYSEGLGLDEAGVAKLRNGQVEVDAELRTSVPNIFAIGDLVPGPALAHKAEEEGVAAAEIIAGKPGHVDHRTIPSVVYTEPELAMVGLTEAQAKAEGHKIKVGRFLFRANGRAKSMAADEGLFKFVVHAETDRILGAHAVGARASEMIAEAVVAMEMHASAEDLARTVHAHPTLSEIVKEAALDVDKRAIHA